MKKILLGITCFFVYIFSVQAQNLYGMTYGGGSNDVGVILSFNPSTSTYIKLHDFDGINGANPSASLMQASDGKLYGMTVNGGSNNYGVIFSFDPSSSTYTKLKDFDGTTGANPYGSLIQASDGKLYGMTYGGGSSGYGVIFSFDPSSSIYTKLKDFDGTTGANPYGSLMQATDGKLYGMTTYGGNSIYGVIFSFDPSSSTYTKLKDFDFMYISDFESNGDGAYPYGSLMQATDGKLYGMTTYGGNNDVYKEGSGIGVIFSFDLPSSTYTKLKDFERTGYYPFGSLIQASDGKLYGMTHDDAEYGDLGNLFSFDPSSSTYTKLNNFSPPDGINPYGSLMQASDENLYGMTYLGGTSNVGVIFSFAPSSSTYTKLKDFDYINGRNPYLGSAFIELQECLAKTYYQDADGDGYGNPNSSIQACNQPTGYVKDNTDCNDNNAAIHAPVTYYRDADGDGYGDANNSISVCETTPPAGYVNNNYDCDDHDNAKKSGNEKVVMCNNGKPQCVNAKDIQKRLDKGWILGPCASAPATISTAENEGIYNEQSIPRQYKLSSYPNPFVGTSTIKYELPFDSKVSIKVYDLMGREIATLVDANKKAGAYTVDFKAGNLNKGFLYYRIIATSKGNQFEQTNKMIQIQ
jgi:uncharacterized repeat protein (TIGR03803 family)